MSEEKENKEHIEELIRTSHLEEERREKEKQARLEEELQKMAMDFLYADGDGDPRCDVLLNSLASYYGTSPEIIRRKIRELAKGN